MSINGKLYMYCDWIWKFCYINLLWGLFTIMGGVIFGITPATVSLFTITRKWIRGEKDVPIWATFWKTYKTEFLKSNALGLIYVVVGLILYFDERLIISHPGTLNRGYIIAFLVLAFIYLLSLLYFFPVYVHYELNPRAYIKYSIMIAFNQFPYTIIMIAGLWASYIILKYLPGITLFLGSGILSFTLMWAANKAFSRLKMKAAKIQGIELDNFK